MTPSTCVPDSWAHSDRQICAAYGKCELALLLRKSGGAALTVLTLEVGTEVDALPPGERQFAVAREFVDADSAVYRVQFAEPSEESAGSASLGVGLESDEVAAGPIGAEHRGRDLRRGRYVAEQ